MTAPSLEALARRFVGAVDAMPNLVVEVGDVRVLVRADRHELVEALRAYFGPWLHMHGKPPSGSDAKATIEVIAIEAAPSDFDVAFKDWPRDPGKVGRKEAIADIDGGRIVRKVRTGMHFLIGPAVRIAIGPCAANVNQVINFVNAQVLNHYFERGFALCHSSGVVIGERGVAISGFSGGGKSTLALWLMSDGADFVSNDRILVDSQQPRARMIGVPKLPRINPGTLLANPALAGILPSDRVQELQRLEPSELWDIEEKYDVDIDRCYGPGHIRSAAPLDAFLVLSWQRQSDEPMRIDEVDLSERRDLIAAVRKPPGPFWIDSQGRAPSAPLEADDEAYLAALAAVRDFEAKGRVDFAAARAFLGAL